MSFQDTWSDEDVFEDGPWPRFPDLAVRHQVTRADKLWMVGIFGVIALAGIAIVTLAILAATGALGPSFTDRCQHAGGVVVDHQCIHKGAIIKIP